MCANSSWRRRVENPVAAFAAKYCAVIEQTSPMTPSAIKSMHILTMYGLFDPPIPWSITAAITSGTNSSNSASSILNKGASTVSFSYPFK